MWAVLRKFTDLCWFNLETQYLQAPSELFQINKMHTTAGNKHDIFKRNEINKIWNKEAIKLISLEQKYRQINHKLLLNQALCPVELK